MRTAELAAACVIIFLSGIVMDKFVDMIVSALAVIGRPILDAARFLFNELGPIAWVVCALVPLVVILGFSTRVRSRGR